jgi:hypothetical protein
VSFNQVNVSWTAQPTPDQLARTISEIKQEVATQCLSASSQHESESVCSVIKKTSVVASTNSEGGGGGNSGQDVHNVAIWRVYVDWWYQGASYTYYADLSGLPSNTTYAAVCNDLNDVGFNDCVSSFAWCPLGYLYNQLLSDGRTMYLCTPYVNPYGYAGKFWRNAGCSGNYMYWDALPDGGTGVINFYDHTFYGTLDNMNDDISSLECDICLL